MKLENYNNIFNSPFFIKTIFEQHGLGLVVTNSNFEIKFVNDNFFEITGYSLSEVLGKNIGFLYVNNIDNSVDFDSTKERDIFETTIKNKEGVEFNVWISMFNFTEKSTGYAQKLIILDKFLNSTVENLGFLFQKFYELSPVGVVFGTSEMEIIKANDVFCKWLGYTESELKQLGTLAITHPDDRDSNMNLLSNSLDSGSVHYSMEKRYITKSGSIIYANLIVTILLDKHKKVQYLTGYVINITEHKLKEKALQESENVFKTWFEESPLGIAMVGKTGEILKVNKKICAFTEYEAEDLVGHNVVEFSNTARRNFSFFSEKIDSAPEYLKPIKLERKYKNKIGETIYLSVNISPVLKQDSSKLDYYIVMLENITDRKMNEFKATENETRFKSIFENNAMPICILNKDSDFLNVNPAFCSLLGYSTTELLTLKLTDIIHPESERLTHKEVESFEQGNTPYYKNLQRILTRKNGEKVYVKADLTGIYNNDNEYLYEVAIIEDISEKLRNEAALKKSLEMQNAVLMALPELTFHVNKKGEYLNVFFNYNTQKDLFVGYEKFLGKTIHEVMPPPIAAMFMELITESLEQKAIKTKEYNLEILGKQQYFKALISPINDDEVVSCSQNITELKVVQIQLQEKILELSQKNKQLESYINSNLALENFAYIAAHDLREPLRSIGSFTQILASEIHKNLPMNPKIQESIEFITNSTQQLNNVINDLLEFSKIKNEKLTKQNIDFEIVIKGVLAQLSKLIAETNTQVVHNIPPNMNLEGSYNQLILVFQNLIHNAIKFRKKDQSCSIHISANELQNEWQFNITDNCIGIEPQYHEKIFILFRRLHSRKEYQGSGIGLTLCKEIIEKHGGNITLESQFGVGTTFSFTLPKNE